jgi:hypothetical protein
MKRDPFDEFREFRSAVGLVAEKTKHRRQQFVKFPNSWVERLQTARRVSTYRLALFLLHRHWKWGGKPVRVSNIAVGWVGLSDKNKKLGALRELESLGLIRVTRRPHRSAEVELLFPEEQ